MTGPGTWPSTLALAWLLSGAQVAPCALEESRNTPPTSTTNAAALSASSLPSAVSSEIERFVKQSGRDLPGSSTESPAQRDRRPRIPLPVPLPPEAPTGPDRGSTSHSPLATYPRLDPAPYLPTDLRFPINLATALRLSDARPLVVAAAQARVWVAEAELAQAKVLWVPDLFVGFAYVRHDGGGPDFNKGIMTAPSVNYFYGGGGLNLFFGTTDALFDPLVARQDLNARQWDVQAAKNDALRETADAYFRVHQYRGIYASTIYTVDRGHQLIGRLAELGRDLVPAYEVDRARNMVADLQQHAAMARQRWRVESARLTKVLRLDPRAVVEPLEHDHTQITLIDPGRSLDDLMAVALNNRPELSSRRASIRAAEIRVRREKARPVLPSILLNGYQNPGGMLIQAGIFGIGPNSSLNQWRGRDDISIQLFWQLENLGFGNLARIKQQRGRESRAIVDLRNEQDRVAEEVNQALARVQAAAPRVLQADRALRTGIITYNGSAEGLKQTSRFGDVLVLVTRPQEAIYALQLLQRAFDEYFTTVADYNRAQFELFHALGYPAFEVARRDSTGPVMPVPTARPPYLPPVGNGPPPATR